MSGEDKETDVLIVNPEEDEGYVLRDSGGETSDDNGDRKSLSMDEALDTAGFGRFHYLMVLVMGWANSADAVEMLSISFVLPYASCELKATDLQLGFLTAVGFAGMMLGSMVWGGVSDVKGRIKAMILCQAINSLFIVGSALSQSLWFLIIMRLFSGFGVGGTSPLIFVYVVELLPLKNRGRMTGILTCSFMVGQILVAGMAWFIIPQTEWTTTTGTFTFNSWRIFMLVSALPAITSCLLFTWFPESPRYLIRMNRMEEAKAAIRKVYRKNGNTLPYNDNYTIARHVGPIPKSGLCNALTEVAKNSWNLVALPKIRPRFLYSSVVLFCLSFSYYGLTMWFPTLIDRMDASNATSVCDSSINDTSHTSACEDTSKQSAVYLDTFLQAVSSLPGNLLYLLLVDVVGRKVITGVTMLLTALSVFLIWAISSRTGSIVVSCVFAAITVMSWNAMALISTEIFPTELRSTARGLQSAVFNRVASITATVVFGALISTHCAVPILLIASLLVLGAALTYMLPNTTNAPVD